MQVRSNYSSYPLQCVQTCIFGSSGMLETWTSIKALLSMGDCVRLCSPGASEPWPRGAGAGSWATARSTGKTKVCCLLPDAWIDEAPPKSLDIWCHCRSIPVCLGGTGVPVSEEERMEFPSRVEGGVDHGLVRRCVSRSPLLSTSAHEFAGNKQVRESCDLKF